MYHMQTYSAKISTEDYLLSKLLGIELQWMEEGRLPKYFVLAGGLLF